MRVEMHHGQRTANPVRGDQRRYLAGHRRAHAFQSCVGQREVARVAHEGRRRDVEVRVLASHSLWLAVRIARGPKRAPGRLVTEPSATRSARALQGANAGFESRRFRIGKSVPPYGKRRWCIAAKFFITKNAFSQSEIRAVSR